MSAKVLIFESDPVFAAELQSGLAQCGCETTVVDDPVAGLQAAAHYGPELILVSIEFPQMNGFAVCNKLKRSPSLRNVPLIVLSSECTDETFEQHRRLRTRAERYVHKPISFRELLKYIGEFIPASANASAVPDRSSVTAKPDRAPASSHRGRRVSDRAKVSPARGRAGRSRSPPLAGTGTRPGRGGSRTRSSTARRAYSSWCPALGPSRLCRP